MKLLIVILLIIKTSCYGQEVGYSIGFQDQDPLYGICLQKTKKFYGVESNCFYSQRTNKKQKSDYLTFMATAKVGYFSKAFGYAGYGLSLNPTLDHSDNRNHTYLSFSPCVGGGYGKNVIFDFKFIYDVGLTGGYLVNEQLCKYTNVILLAGLKFKLK